MTQISISEKSGVGSERTKVRGVDDRVLGAQSKRTEHLSTIFW